MKILTVALFFSLTACSSVPVATTDIKTAAEPPAAPVIVAPPVTAAPPVAVAPNFLLIISDDQRYDTMDFMPLTKKLIFNEGVTFEKAYVTTSLCCVSRASMFTGLYGLHHGVHSNEDPLLKRTVIQALHDHGYYTGLVGKYLNSWDPSKPRPEFDRWVDEARQGWGPKDPDLQRRGPYIDPFISVDGTWKKTPGYLTYIQRDYAVEFLRTAAKQNKPFFLLFAPFSPHGPATPAPEDANLYVDLPLHRPPSFNEADVSDKPAWVREHSLVPVDTIDRFRRKQLQAQKSLDRSVAAVVRELQSLGQLDNTVIFYISDNGILWGEHRLTKKDKVYEESIRVPFAIRYPKLTHRPRVESRLVANIDIAPTIYDLAGLAPPGKMDGRSLVPLLSPTTATPWRNDIVIESWPTNTPAFVALHTERYVYVETVGDKPEFYDLKKDPYQLQNAVDMPEYRTMVTKLANRLRKTRSLKDYQKAPMRLNQWGD